MKKSLLLIVASGLLLIAGFSGYRIFHRNGSAAAQVPEAEAAPGPGISAAAVSSVQVPEIAASSSAVAKKDIPPEAPVQVTAVPGGRFQPIAEAQIVDRRITTVSKDQKKRELLVDAGGKYPFRRVEETLQKKDGTDTYTIVSRTEMAADHVLVKLLEGKSEDDLRTILGNYGVSILRSLSLPGHYIVSLKAPTLDAVKEAISVFSAESELFAYVEPDYLSHITAVPNDARWGDLWGMVKINATGAWDATTGSTNVVVAVIDTGIDLAHSDLASNLWGNAAEVNGVTGVDDDGNGFTDDTSGWDFINNDSNPSDDNGHGTHCAGTVGAVGNNGQGVAGVCWKVRLMALKVLDANGSGSAEGWESDIADAIRYASDKRVNVISASFGGGSYSDTARDAIVYANSKGVLFVAAAGNDGANNDSTPAYPASYDVPNIVAVAATDQNDALASFSNYGKTSVDLTAPGVNIYSTALGGGIESMQGTSMACPHVAGAAALLLSANPGLTHLQVKEALLNTVDKLPALAAKTVSGGRLNVKNLIALQDTDGDGMPDDWETANGLNPNNPLDALLDPDGDHLNNRGEYENRCNPHNTDTDTDSLVDGWEVTYGFSPNSPTGGLALAASRGRFYTSGDAVNIAVAGSYAYVADGAAGLTVLNISDPEHPVRTGSYDTEGTANDVAVAGGYAYVADGANGLVIVNVANPASPVLAGWTNTAGTAEGVAVYGNYVYVADGTNEMVVINAANPASPQKVGSNFPVVRTMHDIFAQGTSAYVAMNEDVKRFDVSNPGPIVYANAAASGGFTTWNMVGVHGNGSVIAAAAGVNGVSIMNTNLVKMGSYDTDGTASGVFVSSNYVYVADGTNGLVVLNISNPTNPVLAVRVSTAGAASGVFVSGGYTYVAEGSAGIEIFSILPDSDGDGMDDAWELQHFGTLGQGASDDSDSDGIINRGEYLAGLDPTDSDQDADGLVDGTQEVLIHNTDPRLADTDGDGLTDGDEVVRVGSNPTLADTDNDGMNDGWEDTYGFDPLEGLNPGPSGDADGDKLTNLEESQNGTDPNDSDSDNDGMPDGWEVARGLNPLVNDAALDPDSDNLTNLQEFGLGTDPHGNDSDADGMPDGWEYTYMPPFNPTNNADGLLDFDSDGLTNKFEYSSGCNPTNTDSDADGMPDGWEVAHGLLPTSAAGMNGASGDPDNDRLLNIQEYSLCDSNLWLTVYTSVTGAPASFAFGMPGFTDPLDDDSDNDGLNDLFEITTNGTSNLFITNPNDADTDNDGFSDAWEIANAFNPLVVENPVTTDRDHDGLTDAEELALGTQPNNNRDPVFVDDDGPNDRWPGNPDGFGPNIENGTISNAYDSIQQAVDAATNGMTVLLNNGEYYGTGNYNINPQGKAITIRAWTTNNPMGTVVNSLGFGPVFIMRSGESTNTVIQGLGITVTLNACSDGDCDYEHGVVLSNASPRIVNCAIFDCALDGIHCGSGANPLIQDSSILNVLNGIWCEGGASPRIENCTISNIGHGEAGDVGIGIYVNGSSGLYIGGCDISDCNGRGISIKDSANATIELSTVRDNRGGITCDNSSPRIERCVIQGNQAPNYYTFNGMSFVGNITFPLKTDGYKDTTDEDENGAGVLMLRGSSPFLVNNLVVSNRTWADDPVLHYNGAGEVIQDYGLGGGFYVGTDCSPTGANCTVADNHANTRGGGLSSSHSFYLRNMILWGNTASNAIIDKDVRTVNSNTVYRNLNCRSGSLNITYSDIQYGFASAKNSITSDPKFVGGGDYQLAGTNSPCYNKAGPDLAPTNDITGFARPTEDDWPDRVDMGCYEFADNDGDGMNNAWERANGLDPENPADALLDSDSDGLANLYEYQIGTDPQNSDTDSDGLDDAAEITAGTVPHNRDTDGDSLSDGYEVLAGLDPNRPDTDSDGMPDGWEVAHSLNPQGNDASSDADSDGLTNLFEYQTGTNPSDPDTDSDGLPDKWENNNNLDPKSGAGADGAQGDPDYDDLTNIEEYNRGTNPQNSDTDGDGISDGDEVNAGTDPLDPDADGDGMPNGWEIDNGLDPAINDAAADADNDDLTNLKEYQNGTDPNDSDSDDDGMPDGWEVTRGIDPLTADSGLDPDGDGLTNQQEYQAGTNPGSADTDSDGMPDGWELNNGLNPRTGDASADADSDSLTNLKEYQNGTGPNDADTDDDGMPDGWEVVHSLNPNADDASADPDSDNGSNLREYQNSTDPHVSDLQYLDTDNDGMPDGWENDHGLNRLVDDSAGDADGDGLTNLREYQLGTDPQDADSDNDGLTDGLEVITFNTQPLNALDPLFVDDNAPGDPLHGDPEINDPLENGSINHPFDSIQKAIDTNTTVNGMTVLVTNGLYEGAGNYSISLRGKAITVRSWNGSTNTFIKTHAYGSAFVVNNAETTNTVIQGFTIETYGDLAPEEGVVVNGASPILKDLVIHNCEKEAVSCINAAAPWIINCRFYDVTNGLYANGSAGVLLQQTVISNTAGRGIMILNDDLAQITWSIIENCAGGITLDNSDASIRQCIVRNNDAPNYYINNGVLFKEPMLYNWSAPQDLLADETSLDENGAGILLLNGSSPLLRNCLITGNTTWADDPTYCVSADPCPLFGLGAGIYIGDGCNPTGVNCTVVNNHANTRGGGVSSSGRPFFRNMIFWDNTSDNAIIVAPDRDTSIVPAYQDIYLSDEVINIWYSDIEHGYLNAVLCITSDPQFVGGGDYSLQGTSPCIDTGTYYLAPLVDLDGNVRPSVLPDRVDMGCYEFGASASTNPIALGAEIVQEEPAADPLADTDGDGFTDGAEIIAGTDMYKDTDYFRIHHEQSQANGSVLVAWQSVSGSLYTVQSTDSLTGLWVDEPGYTGLPGTGEVMSFAKTLPESVRFYRVLVCQP